MLSSIGIWFYVSVGKFLEYVCTIYFLWSHLMSVIQEILKHSEEKITTECSTITKETLQSVPESRSCKFEIRLQVEGEHFGHI